MRCPGGAAVHPPLVRPLALYTAPPPEDDARRYSCDEAAHRCCLTAITPRSLGSFDASWGWALGIAPALAAPLAPPSPAAEAQPRAAPSAPDPSASAVQRHLRRRPAFACRPPPTPSTAPSMTTRPSSSAARSTATPHHPRPLPPRHHRPRPLTRCSPSPISTRSLDVVGVVSSSSRGRGGRAAARGLRASPGRPGGRRLNLSIDVDVMYNVFEWVPHR